MLLLPLTQSISFFSVGKPLIIPAGQGPSRGGGTIESSCYVGLFGWERCSGGGRKIVDCGVYLGDIISIRIALGPKDIRTKTKVEATVVAKSSNSTGSGVCPMVCETLEYKAQMGCWTTSSTPAMAGHAFTLSWCQLTGEFVCEHGLQKAALISKSECRGVVVLRSDWPHRRKATNVTVQETRG